jgi:hypothetical protein
MTSASDTTPSSDDSGRILLFATWFVLAIIMLFFPCIFRQTTRRLWCRRIRQRRWNVDSHDIYSEQFVRRYPIGDPRHIVSNEEAEKMKKEYIVQELSQFTKVIETADVFKSSKVQGSHQEEESSFSDANHLKDQGSDIEKGHNNEVSNSKSLVEGSDVEQDTEKGEFNDRDDSSPDDQDKEEQHNETLTVLRLPPPGSPTYGKGDEENSITNTDLREAPGECSICLNEFKVGERVSWSPKQCLHAFHEDCIIEWLLTLGRNSDDRRHTHTIKCDYKMHCPVCRQEFI